MPGDTEAAAKPLKTTHWARYARAISIGIRRCIIRPSRRGRLKRQRSRDSNLRLDWHNGRVPVDSSIIGTLLLIIRGLNGNIGGVLAIAIPDCILFMLSHEVTHEVVLSITFPIIALCLMTLDIR